MEPVSNPSDSTKLKNKMLMLKVCSKKLKLILKCHKTTLIMELLIKLFIINKLKTHTNKFIKIIKNLLSLIIKLNLIMLNNNHNTLCIKILLNNKKWYNMVIQTSNCLKTNSNNLSNYKLNKIKCKINNMGMDNKSKIDPISKINMLLIISMILCQKPILHHPKDLINTKKS
jgi:hypothetical protein